MLSKRDAIPDVLYSNVPLVHEGLLVVAIQGLNYNSGSEIKIRLIEFGSKDQYLPYEAIIGTMLHELCHNDIGPHNAQFYKLLDEITLVCHQSFLCEVCL